LSAEGDLREVGELRVSLLQLPSKDGDVEANLELLRTILKTVKADLYLTPEMFLTGFEPVEGNFSINGIWSKVRELSEGKVLGVGGPLEEDGRLYNAYLVFNDKRLVHIRKKKILFKAMREHETFSIGNDPSVFELKGFKFSIFICYEVRFPELFYKPFQEGVEVLVIPAAWPESRVMAWKALVKARAIENLAYSIGINRWGNGKYGPFGGHSSITKPTGESVELGDGIGFLTYSISKEEVLSSRKFPSYEDRIELMTKANILP